MVGMTGFEPATTRPPDEYSTGLSYIPISAVANVISASASIKRKSKYQVQRTKLFRPIMKENSSIL